MRCISCVRAYYSITAFSLYTTRTTHFSPPASRIYPPLLYTLPSQSSAGPGNGAGGAQAAARSSARSVPLRGAADPLHITIEDARVMLERKGISSRLHEAELQKLASPATGQIDLAKAVDRASEPTILSKVLTEDIAVVDWANFTATVREVYDDVERTVPSSKGKPADYIPTLSEVDPNLFAVSITTVDGQHFTYGNTGNRVQLPGTRAASLGTPLPGLPPLSSNYEDLKFSVQSCIKPLLYAVALEERGLSKVHKHVGFEPSGLAFNEVVLNSYNRPHSPMLNAGAMIVGSLIQPHLDMAARFRHFFNIACDAAGSERLGFSNNTYLCEQETAWRNRALQFICQEAGAFPSDVDPNAALDFYLQACSIEVSTRAAANIAAMFAAGGVSPITGKRIFSPLTVKCTLGICYNSGLYNASGDWQVYCGVPAKSGVSGLIWMSVPHTMGIAVFSPPLDERGNSVRAVAMCERLAKKFKLGIFDRVVEGQRLRLLRPVASARKALAGSTYPSRLLSTCDTLRSEPSTRSPKRSEQPGAGPTSPVQDSLPVAETAASAHLPYARVACSEPVSGFATAAHSDGRPDSLAQSGAADSQAGDHTPVPESHVSGLPSLLPATIRNPAAATGPQAATASTVSGQPSHTSSEIPPSPLVRHQDEHALPSDQLLQILEPEQRTEESRARIISTQSADASSRDLARSSSSSRLSIKLPSKARSAPATAVEPGDPEHRFLSSESRLSQHSTLRRRVRLADQACATGSSVERWRSVLLELARVWRAFKLLSTASQDDPGFLLPGVPRARLASNLGDVAGILLSDSDADAKSGDEYDRQRRVLAAAALPPDFELEDVLNAPKHTVHVHILERLLAWNGVGPLTPEAHPVAVQQLHAIASAAVPHATLELSADLAMPYVRFTHLFLDGVNDNLIIRTMLGSLSVATFRGFAADMEAMMLAVSRSVHGGNVVQGISLEALGQLPQADSQMLDRALLPARADTVVHGYYDALVSLPVVRSVQDIQSMSSGVPACNPARPSPLLGPSNLQTPARPPSVPGMSRAVSLGDKNYKLRSPLTTEPRQAMASPRAPEAVAMDSTLHGPSMTSSAPPSAQVGKLIEELAFANPDAFGLAICSVDGQQLAVGEADQVFPLMDTVKPLLYALALQDCGDHEVHSYVGQEPSAFDVSTFELLSSKGAQHGSNNVGPVPPTVPSYDQLQGLLPGQQAARHGAPGAPRLHHSSSSTALRAMAEKEEAVGPAAKPYSPFHDSGMLGICALIGDGKRKHAAPRAASSAANSTPRVASGRAFHDSGARFTHLQNTLQAMAGGRRVSFNNSVFLGLKQKHLRHLALSHFLKGMGCYPPQAEPTDVANFAFQAMATETSCRDLAIMGATLANIGVNPLTRRRVFDREVMRNVLSLMFSCGLGPFAGSWAFTVGTPAASGLSGAVLVVVPGVMGMAIYSPRINAARVPPRAIKLCSLLTARYRTNIFDALVAGATQMQALDPREEPSADMQVREARADPDMTTFKLCRAAARGEVAELRELLQLNPDVDRGDYSGRTPLHIAAAAGKYDCAHILLEAGAHAALRDCMGRTPAMDAVTAGHTELIALLEQASEDQGVPAGTEDCDTCTDTGSCSDRVPERRYRVPMAAVRQRRRREQLAGSGSFDVTSDT